MHSTYVSLDKFQYIVMSHHKRRERVRAASFMSLRPKRKRRRLAFGCMKISASRPVFYQKVAAHAATKIFYHH